MIISTLCPNYKKFNKRIKLKPHFIDNTKVKEQTKEEIFRKPPNKKCAPNKNQHTSEIFVEPRKNGIKNKLQTICACEYTNLSKKEPKALEERKQRKYCLNIR